MPCDLLWAFRCPNYEYVLRLKGNEEYYREEMVLEEFWSRLLIPYPHEKNYIKKNRINGCKEETTKYI